MTLDELDVLLKTAQAPYDHTLQPRRNMAVATLAPTLLAIAKAARDFVAARKKNEFVTSRAAYVRMTDALAELDVKA